MNQTDRLALYLVKAVVGDGDMGVVKFGASGRMHMFGVNNRVMRLAEQMAKQGLLPEDLDRTEGRDALRAVADVVKQPKEAEERNINNETADITRLAFYRLPREWQHVVLHAKRLIDMFANPPRTAKPKQ